jgi:hypothetical protein
MKNLIFLFVLLFVTIVFIGCGGGYNLTKYENAPSLGSSKEFNDDEDLAEIQLDMATIILDLAIGQDDVNDKEFCLQTLEKLENHDEIQYCSYSVDSKRDLESSLDNLGTIAEELIWENYYFVYVINNSGGTKIYYYDSIYNSGTLYELK